MADSLVDPRHPTSEQRRARRHRRFRNLLICIGIFALLAALSAWCSRGEVEVEPDLPSPFEEALADDPWALAESQRLLAAEAANKGRVSAAVIHARQATMAAFMTLPEEITLRRAERGVTRSRDERDIWENAQTVAFAADASATWAVVRNGMRPNDHTGNQDRAFTAQADVRTARRTVDEVWAMTRVHWEEHRGDEAESAWADTALAWAHAADAWAYAQSSVDEFFNEALAAWWDNH
ncbi:hypothetical protein [Candidatus Poriferisodalis sp.]|uniref:hypothetical protein n=1 Tax=Candidatus Poriferisodalis sp. TaxID=3101277 RepID=UPI003B01446B